MLLQPAAAAPKDDCEKDGGKWVVSGKIGFCFRELKPDECKLEPIPEPQDPPLRVCGGLIVVDPDSDEEEDSSPAEILDSALDFADVDLDGTKDGGGGDGGDGTEDSNNEQQQQSSTQDRTQGDSNIDQNTQSRVQRQVVVDDDGTGGSDGGPQQD